MQGKGISGPKIQDLAVTCLADFAETSLVNCGKIAAVSGGPALAEIASAAVHDRHRSTLESQLTRLMSILAQDCPIRYPTPHCTCRYHGLQPYVMRSVWQTSACLSFTLALLILALASWEMSSMLQPILISRGPARALSLVKQLVCTRYKVSGSQDGEWQQVSDNPGPEL